MKTIKIIIVLVMLCIPFLKANSTVHTITASGMLFTPSSLNVIVGDTIKWVWVDGIHTTTSTSIPSNSVPWSSFLDSLHTAFSYVVTVPGTYNYYCLHHYLFGMVGVFTANPAGIKIISGNIPAKFNLSQNYPNPFNPSTNIEFDIAVQSKVQLVLYNLIGDEVSTLINQEMNPGSYSIHWNASQLPSGVYFYRLSTPNFSATKKMMLIK